MIDDIMADQFSQTIYSDSAQQCVYFYQTRTYFYKILQAYMKKIILFIIILSTTMTGGPANGEGAKAKRN